MRIVSTGLITPSGIAIDWYTEKIYWTDGETNRIEVIGIDQKYRKVLFWSDIDLARAIAVVPKDGYVLRLLNSNQITIIFAETLIKL